MCFNEQKCKIVHFGKNNPRHNYTLNQTVLEKSECERDIGVIIHQSLKPSEHCSKIVQKANAVLGQMSRAVKYKPLKVWVKLFTTYVRPHLEFAVQAWSPWQRGDIEKIEKVQERALNQCPKLNGLSYDEKLKKQRCNL